MALWSQKLGVRNMFNISTLLTPLWAEQTWPRGAARSTQGWRPSVLQLWKSPMASTTHGLAAHLQLSSSRSQSGKPDRRDKIKQTAFCVGRCYVFFKHRGDWLCVFIYGGIHLMVKYTLWRPRGSVIRGSRVCEPVKAFLARWKGAAHSSAIILLQYSYNMPSPDHHVYQSYYKSFLLQRKHLLWLHALLLANVIVVIIPGRTRFTVNMSATLMRLDGAPNNLSGEHPEGVADFYTAVTSSGALNENFWVQTGGRAALHQYDIDGMIFFLQFTCFYLNSGILNDHINWIQFTHTIS